MKAILCLDRAILAAIQGCTRNPKYDPAVQREARRVVLQQGIPTVWSSVVTTRTQRLRWERKIEYRPRMDGHVEGWYLTREGQDALTSSSKQS
jgi:hypothetical protein